MMKLNNWSTLRDPRDSYAAPETRSTCLQGVVEFHEGLHARGGFVEGKAICTSPIKSIEGRVITTHSGSKYLLGTIDPNFRQMLKEQRPEWDWRNPIQSMKEQL